MSIRDQLEQLKAGDTLPGKSASKLRTHPTGWEPGFQWDGQQGQLSSGPMVDDPDPAIWEELISDWGLDPKVTAIDPDSVQVRGWDAAIGDGIVRRMKYYKVRLIARRDVSIRADVEQLCKEVRKRSKNPRKPARTDTDYRAMLAALSDWQMGKGEGDGSAGTVDRILCSLEGLCDRIRAMRDAGTPVTELVLIGLGDLIEQCARHYPSQQFTTDLDRREQMKVVRELLYRHVEALLPLVDRIRFVAVGGNHGENRNAAGKAFTTVSDNDDLAVFDGLREVMNANPDRFSRVSVQTSEFLSDTFDAGGVTVGIAHMHQGRQGTNPQQKVESWWAGHTLGRGRVHDADLLITAHYHHLMVSEATGRTWIQVPAQDPGSAWFREATGKHSPTGMVTVCVGDQYRLDHGRAWGDLAIV